MIIFWTLVLIILLIVSLFVFQGQNTQKKDLLIADCSAKVERWHNLTKVKAIKEQTFSQVFWGDQYQYNQWQKGLLSGADDAKTLGDEVQLYQDKDLGSMMKMDTCSFSGDWQIYSEHYYDSLGKLFYVFSSVKTFSSMDGPVEVKKEMYFSKDGKIIKQAEGCFRIETKEKISKPNYQDIATPFWFTINALPFYKLLDLQK